MLGWIQADPTEPIRSVITEKMGDEAVRGLMKRYRGNDRDCPDRY